MEYGREYTTEQHLIFSIGLKRYLRLNSNQQLNNSNDNCTTLFFLFPTPIEVKGNKVNYKTHASVSHNTRKLHDEFIKDDITYKKLFDNFDISNITVLKLYRFSPSCGGNWPVCLFLYPTK